MKLNPKDYYCPKHGGNGKPECSICCENLERMLKDMNVYITGETPLNRSYT